MTENKKIENKNKQIFWIIFIPALVVFGLWLINLLALKDYPLDFRSSFGDMFGTVTALFTGLAFAGVIITIWLQKNELELQREELKSTRAEFHVQNKTLKIQRFENTFFQMLSLHHQIVDGMDDIDKRLGKFEPEEIQVKSRDVFKTKYVLNQLKDNLTNWLINSKDLDNIQNSYMNYYVNYANTDFGHYFRNLYRIIKIVDQNEVFTIDSFENENKIFIEKYKYISIVRSQLSDYELLWLFYNCLSINGYEKFKPLIEKYTFFRNLPINKLINPMHKDFYEKSAYDIIKNPFYQKALKPI